LPIVKRWGNGPLRKGWPQEVLYRRIGGNELDAIQICRGFVEAQHEYALQKREGYAVNQYAQKIISTPGKQDGLAWQNADGTWSGPIGEKIGRRLCAVIRAAPSLITATSSSSESQGPAAPLGELDYVIKGVMIGGFALIASPAQYRKPACRPSW